MHFYQVGGAVRDMLLHKPCQDRDFVVTGGTEKEMLALGFKKVGKSFPVFLHPETGEEYALARREVKAGLGHCDFNLNSRRTLLWKRILCGGILPAMLYTEIPIPGKFWIFIRGGMILKSVFCAIFRNILPKIPCGCCGCAGLQRS